MTRERSVCPSPAPVRSSLLAEVPLKEALRYPQSFAFSVSTHSIHKMADRRRRRRRASQDSEDDDESGSGSDSGRSGSPSTKTRGRDPEVVEVAASRTEKKSDVESECVSICSGLAAVSSDSNRRCEKLLRETWALRGAPLLPLLVVQTGSVDSYDSNIPLTQRRLGPFSSLPV